MSTRVGFVNPNLRLGGVELWILTMLKYCRDPRLRWSGVALVSDEPPDPVLVDACREYAPVYRGCDTIGAESDALVAWAVPGVNRLRYGYTGAVIVVSHGFGPWTSAVLADGIACATHLVAVSEPSAAVFGASARVTVIHNGVDTDRCVATTSRRSMRERWGIGPNEPAIGYVGRFSPEKNPLAAALAVAALGSPFRAVYVGDGWCRERVIAEVRERVPDAVVCPPDYQIGNVLHALDCLVLASPAEACSATLIEAWLCGVPVVSTRVGALPELERVHGQLAVPVRIDPSGEELAAAVRIALGGALVPRARAVAQAHLTAETMARRWTDFLIAAASR